VLLRGKENIEYFLYQVKNFSNLKLSNFFGPFFAPLNYKVQKKNN